MEWAHECVNRDGPPPLPHDAFSDIDKYILSTHLRTWRAMRKAVKTDGPLYPVRIIKAYMQVYYNKLKGGIDGNTWYVNAISGKVKQEFKLSVELRVALRAIKHIVVNTAIVTRIIAHADAPQWTTIAQYRARVNRLCPSISSFTFQLSKDLAKKALEVRVSKKRTAAAHGEMTDKVVSASPAELKEIQEKVKDHYAKKRRRVTLLEDFNHGQLLNVRLDSSLRHCGVKIGTKTIAGGATKNLTLTCIVCGKEGAARRCKICGVSLHMTDNKGQKKDCFYRFHCNKKLDMTPSRKKSTPAANDDM
jgi:hypothetical protein